MQPCIYYTLCPYVITRYDPTFDRTTTGPQLVGYGCWTLILVTTRRCRDLVTLAALPCRTPLVWTFTVGQRLRLVVVVGGRWFTFDFTGGCDCVEFTRYGRIYGRTFTHVYPLLLRLSVGAGYVAIYYLCTHVTVTGLTAFTVTFGCWLRC